MKLQNTRKASELELRTLNLHHDTFTVKMWGILRKKHEAGYSGYLTCPRENLLQGLHRAIKCGNWVNVANYAMMLATREQLGIDGTEQVSQD